MVERDRAFRRSQERKAKTKKAKQKRMRYEERDDERSVHEYNRRWSTHTRYDEYDEDEE